MPSDDDFDLFQDRDPTPEETLLLAQRATLLAKAANDSIAASAGTTEGRRKRYLLNPTLRATPRILHAVWSRTECESILTAVEEATRVEGWDTHRHDAFRTVDVPVERLQSEVAEFVRASLEDRVLGVVGKEIGFEKEDFEFVDLFFVLYDATPNSSGRVSQTSLEAHTDGCLISFNVLLNPPAQFVGGGTRFPTLDQTIMLGQGDCVVHDSKLLHEGRQILSGRRVICVGFVESRRKGSVAGKTAGKRDRAMMRQNNVYAKNMSPVVFPLDIFPIIAKHCHPIDARKIQRLNKGISCVITTNDLVW
ncbi:hypothetical protein HK104_009960 [Borealophlyctis nickersoniae]|nr:hypothetical protein HK104_009960 [Borealophlyctis nickersoniae]